MKKLFLALIGVSVAMAAFAQDSEWKGIGTGSYQPGLLDYYAYEYPELVSATVYESTARTGVYKFVPTSPGEGALVPYEVVVHTENANKVWCEPISYFYGIMNYTAYQKVTEAEPPFGADDANYGKIKDGAITFSTPSSFLAMEMTGYKASNLKGEFALYMPGVNPVEDPYASDTWVVMEGKGKYVEGLLDCEYTAGVAWDIDVEQSKEHPSCYRIKPYYEGNPSCPYLPEIANTYVYIHAEDEMEVYTSKVLFLNSQGKGYKVVHRAVAGDEPDYAYYGTLEDNIITFPANSHYATIIGISGAGSVLTNTQGKLTIALPGADLKDYYIKAEHTVCAQSTGDGFCRFPITLYGGADVAGALIGAEPGKKVASEINPQDYMANPVYPSTFFGMQLNMNFPMVAEMYNTNRWSLVMIAMDIDNKPHDVAVTTFFTPEKDEEWEDYAKADFTDLIVSPSYGSYNPTYKVTVQRKINKHGQLRVVNPYLENPEIGKAYMSGHTDHSHYLYVNVEDPDFVYIEESPMGLNLGYGDLVASSEAGSMLNEGLTIEEVKLKGAVGGKKDGDNINFPDLALKFFETEYKNGVLQDGVGGQLLHITEYLSGIEDVNVDTDSDAPVRYYNLNGVEVSNPVSGSFYIKVQGTKATKIIAK